MSSRRLTLNVTVEKYPLKQPFRITDYTMEYAEVVTATLERDGHRGWGEASGVYYRADDDIPGVVRQIEALRSHLEAGISRPLLQELLPAGGARNALDCALWDLEAKESGRTVWQIAGLEQPHPLLTTFTVGANNTEKMAADARAYRQAKAIKIKLTGEAQDADRVRAVRAARPDVWLGVDANQGFTPESLDALMRTLVDSRVQLIEQPFRVGQEAQLDGVDSPIPIAADESAQGLADVTGLLGRFQVVNIKLDKCGGLTDGLLMAQAARRLGLGVMVGNMVGTSLAMAPAFLVGQLCQVVDLDGPVFLQTDRVHAVQYENGNIHCADTVWGAR